MTPDIDTKKKPDNDIVIHIDRKKYKVDDAVLTGAQLRRLPDPDIGVEFDVWREVPGGEDDRVDDGEHVTLKNGMHFFTAPSNINPGHAD